MPTVAWEYLRQLARACRLMAARPVGIRHERVQLSGIGFLVKRLHGDAEFAVAEYLLHAVGYGECHRHHSRGLCLDKHKTPAFRR